MRLWILHLRMWRLLALVWQGGGSSESAGEIKQVGRKSGRNASMDPGLTALPKGLAIWSFGPKEVVLRA